mmetsp:Transcript_48735/g.113785  ORF Transcript_48735/g.113785 Transcript_48735/m.113785 type:complete len:224 (-) Transcript_48735:1049-1720(-)
MVSRMAWKRSKPSSSILNIRPSRLRKIWQTKFAGQRVTGPLSCRTRRRPVRTSRSSSRATTSLRSSLRRRKGAVHPGLDVTLSIKATSTCGMPVPIATSSQTTKAPMDACGSKKDGNAFIPSETGLRASSRICRPSPKFTSAPLGTVEKRSCARWSSKLRSSCVAGNSRGTKLMASAPSRVGSRTISSAQGDSDGPFCARRLNSEEEPSAENRRTPSKLSRDW